MNARYLVVTLFVLGSIALALTSRSTLTPQRGVNNVFYGAEGSHFIGQEVAIGNLNGDDFDDVISAILWDNPSAGGEPVVPWTAAQACTFSWTTIFASKGGDTQTVCAFADSAARAAQWALWANDGWTQDSTAACDSCYTKEAVSEDQGAILVVKGGDWAGKKHDIDLADSLPDLMILGAQPGDKIYNGFAAGNVNFSSESPTLHFDDLVIGAAQNAHVDGSGEVYVIHGKAALFSAFPDTINLADSTDFASLAHVFRGRDTFDQFGMGVAVGDLDKDGNEDIIVAAPHADGPGNARSNSGEIYIFYSNDSLPQNVDLSILDTDSMAADEYVSYIYGDADTSYIGVTEVKEKHADGDDGQYDPTGLAIGDWDGDGFNDLVIGAGRAGANAGKVWVIFGRISTDPLNKLVPGNRIDLANAPGTGINDPDLVFEGIAGSKLGAGVAFVDADTSEVPVRDDLIIGAPLASTGGKSERGEVYIIFGDTETNLTSTRTRDVSNSSHVDVVIYGEDVKDQLGGHFAGHFDLDNDGKNELGISGHKENFVFFGQARADWEATIDLKTVLQDNPETKIIKYVDQPHTASTTIRFADLDNNNTMDLVFGGYDNDGLSGQRHAGRMYVAKGQDTWKSGTVSTNTTWSGNVFVNGDIKIASGATLTIDAGTDVWIWPDDPASPDTSFIDTTKVEFWVFGTLDVNGTNEKHVRFLSYVTDAIESDGRDDWKGILVRSGGDATFDYCEIKNAFRGIAINETASIRNCTIEECDIAVSIAAADSIYIADTVIRNCDFAGINLLQGSVLRFKDSRIDTVDDTGGRGIKVYSGARLWADGSTITECDIGIQVFPDDSTFAFATIDNCTLDGNGDGVCADSIDTVTIKNSTIKNSTADGIRVNNGDITITDNTIDNNATCGIYLDGSQVTIKRNTIKNNTVGIYCDDLSHAAITDSNVINLNTTGIKVDHDSEPKVDGNTITNGTGGVAALNDGDPDLGNGSEGSSGNNSIFGHTSHYVANLSSGFTVMAEDNNWNVTRPPHIPKPAKFFGAVDRDPALPPPSPTSPAPDDLARDIPSVFGLNHGYPNPFNPSTTIKYQVPKPGAFVQIRIYNVLGQLVDKVVNEQQVPGFYSVVWKGTNTRGESVATGVYFLHMRAGQFQKSRKLVLLK